MHRHIVVGLDPGATIGVAILSLSGEKITTGSFSGGGISEAVSFIEKNGTPSLIACDVFPAPEFAQKIASYFSCRLHSPAHNIREEDKRQIARGSGVENNHERDAYTAAVFAFRAHANKLRQIDSLDGFSQEEKDRVKHLLLKGYKVKDAFLELGEPAPAGQSAPSQKQDAPQRSLSSEELRARVSSLARENAHLRMLATRLENEKQQLEARVRLLENGVRQSVLRDSELRKLRFKLGQAVEKLGMRGKNRAGKTQNQHPHAKHPLSPKQNPAMQPPRKQNPAKPVPDLPKQHVSAPLPPSRQKAPSHDVGLYNLGERKMDLDKLVAEYRRGRK